MTDLILQIGASKLALSVVLAVGILAFTRRLGRPALAHGLWLLLLGILLVPPLLSVPVLPPEAGSSAPVVVAGFFDAEATPSAGATLLGLLREYGPGGLLWLWLLGTASVLGWTLVRALRFHRSLVGASGIAPAHVQRMAERIAGRLGLTSVPAVHATDAQVSPMVWCFGGRVRVLLPSALLSAMDAPELGCILAHELAHVRRRDHVVRWIEWGACAAFWWNPVAWWARRRLRAAEELCCDDLALTSSDASPKTYALSLLRAIDLISASPRATAPAFASTAHGRERLHALEERFRMIVSNTPSPTVSTRLRAILRSGAVCLLAAGLVYCGDRGTPVEAEAEPGTSTTDLPASMVDVTVSSADFDGDGDLDLLFAPGGRAGSDLYRNDGMGVFSREPPAEGTFRLYADTLIFTALPSGAAESLRTDLVARIGPLLGEREADLAIIISEKEGWGEQEVLTVDLAGLRERLGETLEATIPEVDIFREFARSSSKVRDLRCHGSMLTGAAPRPKGAAVFLVQGSCERR